MKKWPSQPKQTMCQLQCDPCQDIKLIYKISRYETLLIKKVLFIAAFRAIMMINDPFKRLYYSLGESRIETMDVLT